MKLTKAQRRLVRDNPLAAKLIERSRDDGDCWVWTGSGGPNGYGFIAVEGRTRKVHRVAYEVFCGKIPEGLAVCHHCDRPACINPFHLFLGRAGDNMRDMVRKGRGRRAITAAQDHFRSGDCPRGEAASGAKLTEEQAREIVRRRLAGEMTKSLAAAFQVDRTTIQRLMRGKNWSHLAGRAALANQGGTRP